MILLLKNQSLQLCLVLVLASSVRTEQDVMEDTMEDILVEDTRSSRDASVPAVLLDDPFGADIPIPAVFLDAEESQGSPFVVATLVHEDEVFNAPATPLTAAPLSAVPVPAAPLPAAPLPAAPVPVFEPAPLPPVPTNAHCSIEEVEIETEICKPTVKKTCTKIKLSSKELIPSQQCVKIIKTVCSKSEESVDNELCYYNYQDQEETAEGQTASVKYDKRCENADLPGSCSKQGYGYCKKERTQLCYNEGMVDPEVVPVTVTYPVPEKVCENNPVSLPSVSCSDVEEEMCFPITEAQNVEEEFEKCATDLGPPACEKIVLKFPKEVCVEEIVPEYAPAPAHGYAPAPAPGYAAPGPKYAPGPIHAYAG